MRVTLILGSIRPNRESHKPALFIQQKLIEAGYEVDFVDLKELKLPLFDDSPEQMASPPVISLKNSIANADGIVLVFPEYNHDMSATMRNAMAFLRNREFKHLPISLVAVSNGLVGGARALYAAKASLPTLGGIILPKVVQVPLVQEAFLNEHSCSNPKVAENITAMIKELGIYIPAIKQVRSQLND